MGADPLHLQPFFEALTLTAHGPMDATRLYPLWEALKQTRADGSIMAFYAANVAWTLLYELVYSHQDAAEDTAAGVKSLVLLYASPNAENPNGRFGTMPLYKYFS
ncbi:hypothetical protein RRF57_010692 [Xylaria bambusicola]|uniref:Uncharacterized protein n=1 Tax=Xylaria bambusicola TaxID=326684 RepID=A0AAN7ULM5_9PEZI